MGVLVLMVAMWSEAGSPSIQAYFFMDEMLGVQKKKKKKKTRGLKHK